MSDPWGFRGTVEDYVNMAKAEGAEYAVVLEVPIARCWLLVPGVPTDRLLDRVEENRLAGVQFTVASFDDLNEIVEGLMEQAEAAGFRDGKADRWWWRAWWGLRRLMR